MHMSTSIIMEQVYNASLTDTWKALTVTKQMQEWYFPMMPSFEARQGFETKFNVNANGHDYLHHWRVREVIPQKKISYDWLYPEHGGQSILTWELFDEQGKTRLKLTHAGIESFPQENPDFAQGSFQTGWNFFLNQRLKAFLEPAQKS